jgi:hypothetical protein
MLYLQRDPLRRNVFPGALTRTRPANTFSRIDLALPLTSLRLNGAGIGNDDPRTPSEIT